MAREADGVIFYLSLPEETRREPTHSPIASYLRGFLPAHNKGNTFFHNSKLLVSSSSLRV